MPGSQNSFGEKRPSPHGPERCLRVQCAKSPTSRKTTDREQLGPCEQRGRGGLGLWMFGRGGVHCGPLLGSSSSTWCKLEGRHCLGAPSPEQVVQGRGGDFCQPLGSLGKGGNSCSLLTGPCEVFGTGSGPWAAGVSGDPALCGEGAAGWILAVEPRGTEGWAEAQRRRF